MSGAVKGKGVIMKKRTCVEFDEKMTDLMQQIKDLNAVKDCLFCNLEIMKGHDYLKKLDDIDCKLLAKYEVLFFLINIQIASNECEHQEAENDN